MKVFRSSCGPPLAAVAGSRDLSAAITSAGVRAKLRASRYNFSSSRGFRELLLNDCRVQELDHDECASRVDWW